MRVAMVGLGDIAQKAYLPVVANHADITPMICTRNPATLEQLQRQYRIAEALTDFPSLLNAQPDIVMIHSSTESHYELVKQCLLANIPVFVDKPIGYHYRECEELVNLAARKQLPLVVGFNRRFAPLYQPFKTSPPLQVHYYKNRFNLPAPARQFIFDDFIHVVDFVRSCTPGEIDKINVFSRSVDGLLASIQVQWQSSSALFVAGMNRVHGRTEEQLRYISHNEHWEIHNLSSGYHFKDGKEQRLGFGDWEPTLVKRGFVAMVDNLLNIVREGQQNPADYDDVLATHRLCEDLVVRVE